MSGLIRRLGALLSGDSRVMSKLYEQVKFTSEGRPRAFDTPDEMWGKAIEYFKWCEENTILEKKMFHNQGEVVKADSPHMRAMTQAGLCAFLNIGVSTWHDYKKKSEYSEVTQAVEQVMYEQKFTGAAAGMLNSNIIARDLGLAEKTETELSGGLKVEQSLAERLTGGSKR